MLRPMGEITKWRIKMRSQNRILLIFLTCHKGPRRVHILKFWQRSTLFSHIYDHFCHSGCPPRISGTATAVVTKLA